MATHVDTKRLTWPMAIVIAIFVFGCENENKSARVDGTDQFETVRAHVQSWLSGTNADSMIVSSFYLKNSIVDDWDTQKGKYEIVSLRKPEDHDSAGSIPGAMNIYWVNIVADDNLAKLDSAKTLILYCYYGHASMICGSILELLGYECRSLNFGMMGWNLNALVKPPWDKKADYEVETMTTEPNANFALPVLTSTQRDVKDLVKEMARNYFNGEGSPVIASSAVKVIIDEWNQHYVNYQIIDVRSDSAYRSGHVPHSFNIPLASIAQIENLTKLDPTRITIVYSENGQTGQMVSTVLNLLGYKAVNMNFGMMDWNKSHVDSTKQWSASANYPVET